jgi:hypothetical protein
MHKILLILCNENNMKIIFLDFDGVLNLIPQGRDKFGSIFHKHLVDNLALVIKNTNAKLVITSSGRFDTIESHEKNYNIIPKTKLEIYNEGLNFCEKLWNYRKYPGNILSITPYINGERGKEIQKWLDNHKEITQYVIIDDDNGDMLPNQLIHLVQTSGNSNHIDCVDIGYGLTKICAEKAIKILNKIY